MHRVLNWQERCKADRRDKVKDKIADIESRKSFAAACGRAAGSQGPGSGVSGDLWWKEAGRGCLVTEDQCINLW